MLFEQPYQDKDDKYSKETLQSLSVLAALRVVLTGESTVDTGRLYFNNKKDVDEFLQLLEFDTQNALYLNKIRRIQLDAIDYLADVHGYDLPKKLLNLDIHSLFLLASRDKGQVQRFACMILKVMHILYHLEARTVVFRNPISESQLLDRLNAKVINIIDQLRAKGINIHEFSTGAKTKDSLVTKLLSKKDTVAANIYDKLRFRLVVSHRDELVFTLISIVKNLTPYNYIIPGQSQNGIITLDDIVRALDLAPELVQKHWGMARLPTSLTQSPPTPKNEFSGSSYRCVNFVADIPVRIDDFALTSPPAVAFVQAEIQLVDAETNMANQEGENAHVLYQERKRQQVCRRLEGFGTIPIKLNKSDDNDN